MVMISDTLPPEYWRLPDSKVTLNVEDYWSEKAGQERMGRAWVRCPVCKKIMEQYLIQSIEHQRPGGPVMWWAPHRLGYVDSIERAGRYSKEAAEDRANFRDLVNERAWPESMAYLAKNEVTD